jgi:Zn-dependent protease/CBS domain-containing protein
MKPFSIGRVLGFPISIDPSWFIIFFLILWSFSARLAPMALADYPSGVHLATGLAATLLFFASLLGHELSHALVARAKNIPVEGITLFIFGGIARTRTEATSPGDEFQIAGVGPLASLLIGLAFLGLLVAGARAGWPEPVLLVANILAWLNMLLAAFNMLPGFPLDGGRIFRSIVWKITGNVTTATRWAAAAGRLIALLLMAWGLWRLWRGDTLQGIWMMFIGWFLHNAARSSLRQHELQRSLEKVRVRDAMQPLPRPVPADTSLERLMADHFLPGHQTACAVEENGRIIGIVAVRQMGDVPAAEWHAATARDIMAPLDPEATVTPDDDLLTAIHRIRSSPARRLLVLENGLPAGLLTSAGLDAVLRRVLPAR